MNAPHDVVVFRSPFHFCSYLYHVRMCYHSMHAKGDITTQPENPTPIFRCYQAINSHNEHISKKT